MMMLNLASAYPEIAVLVSACAILLIDLFIPDHKRDTTFWLAQLALLLALALVVSGLREPATFALNGFFVDDFMADVLKIAMIIGTSIMLFYSRAYLVERSTYSGEFMVLVLFSLLGMMVMVSGANLLTLYMGLELQALSLYALVAMNRDSSLSAEAGMKYFILGALASGLLLYGLSMVYGATGTLDVASIYKATLKPDVNRVLLVIGVVFIVSGIAFKLGAVPYHMWVPDVYQGAMTPVTLFVASVPKIAAFAFVLRLLVQGLQGIVAEWQMMIILISSLSVVIGNLTAIVQTNFKRLLAYSAIANMGFMLLGFASGSVQGYASSMFYVISYMLMTLVSFGAILLLARAGFEAEELDDLRGLNRRSPLMAFVVLVAMFSLAGIPLTVGFFAKFAVIQAVVDARLVWLAVLAVLASLVGAYYYLRVVRLMYFDAPTDATLIQPERGPFYLLVANAIVLIVLGILPQRLLSICAHALGLAG